MIALKLKIILLRKEDDKITNTGVCKIKCANCPLSEKNNGKGRLCVDYEMHHPEEAIEIVQKWSNENPQKSNHIECWNQPIPIEESESK